MLLFIFMRLTSILLDKAPEIGNGCPAAQANSGGSIDKDSAARPDAVHQADISHLRLGAGAQLLSSSELAALAAYHQGFSTRNNSFSIKTPETHQAKEQLLTAALEQADNSAINLSHSKRLLVLKSPAYALKVLGKEASQANDELREVLAALDKKAKKLKTLEEKEEKRGVEADVDEPVLNPVSGEVETAAQVGEGEQAEVLEEPKEKVSATLGKLAVQLVLNDAKDSVQFLASNDLEGYKSMTAQFAQELGIKLLGDAYSQSFKDLGAKHRFNMPEITASVDDEVAGQLYAIRLSDVNQYKALVTMLGRKSLKANQAIKVYERVLKLTSELEGVDTSTVQSLATNLLAELSKLSPQFSVEDILMILARKPKQASLAILDLQKSRPRVAAFAEAYNQALSVNASDIKRFFQSCFQ